MSFLLVRGLLFAFGFHWVRVKGVKASKYRAPVIVMSPHSTFFDILPSVCMGDFSVVTRTENLTVPIIGSKMFELGVTNLLVYLVTNNKELFRFASLSTFTI